MHERSLPGTPDFFFPKAKLAIFVDGCFWHACPECGHTPKTRRKYWSAKLQRNADRDRQNLGKLHAAGISVLRIWEHQLKSAGDRRNVIGSVRRKLDSRKKLPKKLKQTAQ